MYKNDKDISSVRISDLRKSVGFLASELVKAYKIINRLNAKCNYLEETLRGVYKEHSSKLEYILVFLITEILIMQQ